MDFSFDGLGSAYCRADTNGHASGNTLEEAILQGFLELVERDALAIWWYNQTNRKRFPWAIIPDSCVGYTITIM